MKRTTLAAAVAAVALLAAPVVAKPASPDMAFMKTAAEAGLAEVAAGELAGKMATNADVKSFGQQMVTDHTKANEELMNLAAKLKVSLPKKTDAKHAALIKKLQGMKDAGFDKAYVKSQVEDHKKAVQLFTKESTSGKDADLKTWAANTLPTLKHHLEMIQDLQKKMK